MYKVLVLPFDGVMDSSLALTLDTIETANRVAGSRREDLPFDFTLFHPGRKRIRTGLGAQIAVRPRDSD